jgi:tripartite-type tricarboxylate transporter receptor subunit TctC
MTIQALPLLLRTLAAAALVLNAGAAAAQAAYPSRPVQMLVPFPAGAPVDTLARAFAQAFDKQVNQRVVTLNREGGSTTVAMNALLQAPADGYTLFYGPVTPITVHLHWMKGLPYKADSFTPVCQTFENIFVLAGGSNSPFKDLPSALAAAKARGTPLTYAHPGVSSSPHLSGAELFQRIGAPATDIPFRGEAAMVGSLRDNSVDLGVVTTGFALNQQLKPLAVFADKRLPAFPDTPTVAELGHPIQPSAYGGLFVRAETPAPVVARIEQACRGAVEDPAFQEMAKRLYQQGDFLDRAKFSARVQADLRSKAELLKTVKLER